MLWTSLCGLRSAMSACRDCFSFASSAPFYAQDAHKRCACALWLSVTSITPFCARDAHKRFLPAHCDSVLLQAHHSAHGMRISALCRSIGAFRIMCVKRGVRALRSKCSFINQQEEVRQARFRDSNRCNEGKAESATGAMQRSGQAANVQSCIGSPGKHRETNSGKMLGNVRRG